MSLESMVQEGLLMAEEIGEGVEEKVFKVYYQNRDE